METNCVGKWVQKKQKFGSFDDLLYRSIKSIGMLEKVGAYFAQKVPSKLDFTHGSHFL